MNVSEHELPCWSMQGFVKSLLEVADNLERAAGSVTDQSLKGLSSDRQELTAPQISKLLKGLLDGVTLTDRILIQVGHLLDQSSSLPVCYSASPL